jgi:phosphomethylpyrimidine synthase
MTQVESARQGVITAEMRAVAKDENLAPEHIRDMVAKGLIVIPCNKNRKATKFCGVGKGLSIKTNANIGSSMDKIDINCELEKLRAAVNAGADAVMDLSTGGNLRELRKAIVENSPITIGSVPIYEAAVKATKEGRGIVKMSEEEMIDAIRMHIEDGVDFITVHCGVTREVVEKLRQAPRVCGIVSRGGTFIAEWTLHNKKENPYFTHFDEILKMCRENDVTLSLGDGLRPGALADAFDHAQIAELMALGDLSRRARKAGVQVIIEGPGHVPLNQVVAQVQMMKEMCDQIPFYVLGPIVTDIAPGYDHITSAIGGAVAGMAGADFLCYVTPSEHLRLPNAQDVHEGVIAARIAGHAADIARGYPGAFERDKNFSKMRKAKDWDGMYANALDPAKAKKMRSELLSSDEKNCSMCGAFCVYGTVEKFF